jgi:hypothetical protein
MEVEFSQETVSGGTDISVGGLTISDRFISRIDCILPYLVDAVQWYVPCAKCANPWTALLRVYTLDVWICVLCTSLPLVMFMRHVAIRVTKYQIRESHRYTTFKSCLTIHFSIAFVVSVTDFFQSYP